MAKTTKYLVVLTLAVTIAVLATWRLTGGDYYTKFEVVEQVEKKVDPDDPLAEAGFYEEGQKETVTRKDFRLGLLPTPSGVWDKHALSVISIVSPFWVATIGLLWWSRRRKPAYTKTA